MKFDARRYLLPALLAAMVAAGCQSLSHVVGQQQDQTAPPVSQLGPPDETHASQWAAGRAIYVGGCASCHKPKPVQDFAIDEWKDKIIPGMSLKAKLTPEQTQSLTDYVMAVKRLQLLGSEHPKPKPAIAPLSPISASDNR